jgi:hypothetical protein
MRMDSLPCAVVKPPNQIQRWSSDPRPSVAPATTIEGILGILHHLMLAGVLGLQAEIREHELPLGIGDIAAIGSVCDHTLYYAGNWTVVHNTL